jgi:hypothetical protein
VTDRDKRAEKKHRAAKTSTKRKIGCSEFIVASGFVLFGFAGLLEWALFFARSERAIGTVVEAKLLETRTRSAFYDVTVEFQTVKGVRKRAVLKRMTRRTVPTTSGQRFGILYRADEPSKIRVDAIFPNWGIYLGLMLFGFFLVAIASLKKTARM